MLHVSYALVTYSDLYLDLLDIYTTHTIYTTNNYDTLAELLQRSQ
jgi:hypothetical protein